MPPELGYCAANWAEEVALQNATPAAISKPISKPEPATAAAGVNAAKMPAPTIEPTPMSTASKVLNFRASPTVRASLIPAIYSYFR